MLQKNSVEQHASFPKHLSSSLTNSLLKNEVPHSFSFSPFEPINLTPMISKTLNKSNIGDTTTNELSFAATSGESSLFSHSSPSVKYKDLKITPTVDNPLNNCPFNEGHTFQNDNCPDAIDVLHTFNFLQIDNDNNESYNELPLDGQDLNSSLTSKADPVSFSNVNGKGPDYVSQMLLKVFPNLSLDKCQEYLEKTNFDLEKALSLLFTEEKLSSSLGLMDKDKIFEPFFLNKAHILKKQPTYDYQDVPLFPNSDWNDDSCFFNSEDSSLKKFEDITSSIAQSFSSNSPPIPMDNIENRPNEDSSVDSSSVASNKGRSSSCSRPICTFFLRGECLRKDCAFSHDLKSTTCKFWLQGECLKGDSCEFLHGVDLYRLETLKKHQEPQLTTAASEPAPSLSKSEESWKSYPKIEKHALANVKLESLNEFPSLSTSSSRTTHSHPESNEPFSPSQQEPSKNTRVSFSEGNSSWSSSKQNLSLADKLKLQKLRSKFPSISRDLIERIFISHKCNESSAISSLKNILISKKSTVSACAPPCHNTPFFQNASSNLWSGQKDTMDHNTYFMRNDTFKPPLEAFPALSPSSVPLPKPKFDTGSSYFNFSLTNPPTIEGEIYNVYGLSPNDIINYLGHLISDIKKKKLSYVNICVKQGNDLMIVEDYIKKYILGASLTSHLSVHVPGESNKPTDSIILRLKMV